MSISAIVVVMNREAVIRRCLESIQWADEIVVVDSGSTDRTVEICRELGAKVYFTPDWPGFGPQKNRATDLATCDWAFILDSDEWCTPELRDEILRTVAAATDEQVAFEFPRRSSFCGRFMKHSGWWPDYVSRLYRRGKARFSEDHTHERLLIQGKRGRMRQPIYHEAVVVIDEMLYKINAYSSDSARIFYGQGRRAGMATALLHGWWGFVRTYCVRLGFLDGREGFLLAVLSAENSFYRYVKLMLLAERKEKSRDG